MNRNLLISKIFILSAWTLFFGWLGSFGQPQLGRLLHPSLWWLVICATIVLALFLAVNLNRQATSSPQNNFWLRWPSLLILLLPLLYFIPTQKGGFNAATLQKRGIQTESGFVSSSLPAMPSTDSAYPPPLDKKKPQTDISLAQLAINPQDYQGNEVEVVCMTFIDARLPENLFMCYRYLITCCAADATPVFIFIKNPEARSVKNDTWIRAKGPFSLIENANTVVPSIQADSVQYIDEPPFPYLF
jgi:putative membrane protein